MAIEIERKFLVQDSRWQEDALSSVLIRQGYLSRTELLSVRVRILDDAQAVLTVKVPRNLLSRLEYETEIPLAEARTLFEQCQDAVVEKRRHAADIGGATWLIDVFMGKNDGLVLAEIELTHEEQDVPRPAWLGREVTDDPRYRSSQLARHPFRAWPSHAVERTELLVG